jgi:hypothetical protein
VPRKSSMLAVGLALSVMAAVSSCGSSSAASTAQSGAANPKSDPAAQMSADHSFASVSELAAALHANGLGCDSVTKDGLGGTCSTTLGNVTLLNFPNCDRKGPFR